jgi:hypothetical protein
MDEPRDDLGREVHRLMSAVQEWARNTFPETPAAAANTGTHADGTTCLAWCPICQFANILRGDHPEVSERLAEAGTALATALKALADATLPRSQPGGGADDPDRPRPSPRVQRIRLDDPDES